MLNFWQHWQIAVGNLVKQLRMVWRRNVNKQFLTFDVNTDDTEKKTQFCFDLELILTVSRLSSRKSTYTFKLLSATRVGLFTSESASSFCIGVGVNLRLESRTGQKRVVNKLKVTETDLGKMDCSFSHRL